MISIKNVKDALYLNIVARWWDLCDCVTAIKKKIQKITNNIKLCHKYPFLYYRDLYSNTHYVNYKIRTKFETLIRDSSNWQDDPCCKRLIKNYYKYYLGCTLKWIHDYPLQLFHCIPTTTLLDDMPSGWRYKFGEKMCKEIKQALLVYGKPALKKYRILEIKEKWGYLHWYDNCGYKNVQDIIYKYENKSYHTCIKCGKSAKYLSKGWIQPYCKVCSKHIPREKLK